MPALVYRLGLLGYPLGHSLSPAIHRAALQALGLSGEYQLYPVIPGSDSLDRLSQFCDRLRQGEFHGLNVTIPYKQAVIPLIDALSPLACAVSAVNTLYIQDGQLIGDNTDVPGFLTHLKSVFGDISPLSPLEGQVGRDLTALVLGAGGAARSVVYALLTTGWKVFLAARRLEQAEELANSFEETLPSRVMTLPLETDAIRDVLAHVTLIVNATPVGMHPLTGASPLPPGAELPSGMYAYDLVYNPPRTEFLRQASQQGGRVSNGLGMLVEQAALSFERWTGISAPRSLMRQAALQALGGDV